MKKLKGLWAVVALGLGAGMGYSASIGLEDPSRVEATNLVECVRDSQCDARCGAAGAGACERGQCRCRF